MRPIAVLHLHSPAASSQCQQLMAKTNAHYGHGRRFHQSRQVVDCRLAVSRVSGTVGDEDAVVAACDLLDGVVIGKDRHGSPPADETAQDVLLDTTVEQGDVDGRVGSRNDKRRFGAHAPDEVDLIGVNKTLVLVCVVVVADCDSGEGRALLA